MTYAIKLHQTGSPDQLKYEDISISSPGPEEILIKHTAIGLNYIDSYHRTGLYPVELPAILGYEAAGIVEAVGVNVSHVKVGDRVAYGNGPLGAYCEKRVIPAENVLKLPDSISDNIAAAVMLKGMTAEYLLERTYPVKKGETVLWHAAAGGVGVLACQWAKHLGATVIGTVGSQEKSALAKVHGCDHTILYREENIVERVDEITKGKGVSVVYDSVGKTTFEASIACLKPRGTLVSFGQSSGPIDSQNLAIFAPKSLFFTRPSLFVYTATRQMLEASVNRVFELIEKNILKVENIQTYPLKEVSQAHVDLESRRLSGSTLLIP